MFSRMHLHCCRWWSLQTRAVPSRLPLTNLRDGPGSVWIIQSDFQRPHVKAAHCRQQSVLRRLKFEFDKPFWWVAELDAVHFVLREGWKMCIKTCVNIQHGWWTSERWWWRVAENAYRVLVELRHFLGISTPQKVYSDDIVGTARCQEHTAYKNGETINE